MTDIVKRLRRYSCESDDPSEALAELVKDMHDAADEIERLRAVVDAAHRLYSGGLYPENHDYVLISDRTLDALDEALDAYDQSSG